MKRWKMEFKILKNLWKNIKNLFQILILINNRSLLFLILYNNWDKYQKLNHKIKLTKIKIFKNY